MRNAVVLLVVFCFSGTGVAALAAPAVCSLPGGTTVQGACCCGDDAACDLPAAESGLNDACCDLDQNTQTAPPSPPAVFGIALADDAPLAPAAGDAPRTSSPLRDTAARTLAAEQPPPYRLFCSLLI